VTAWEHWVLLASPFFHILKGCIFVFFQSVGIFEFEERYGKMTWSTKDSQRH